MCARGRWVLHLNAGQTRLAVAAALTIGLTLIALIIFTMLFGYR